MRTISLFLLLIGLCTGVSANAKSPARKPAAAPKEQIAIADLPAFCASLKGRWIEVNANSYESSSVWFPGPNSVPQVKSVGGHYLHVLQCCADVRPIDSSRMFCKIQ